MCRAQGIAHQKVSAVADLQQALHSAWSLKRHSVVEVITARDSNVEQHRQLQAAVQQAVSQARGLLVPSKIGVSQAWHSLTNSQNLWLLQPRYTWRLPFLVMIAETCASDVSAIVFDVKHHSECHKKLATDA